MKIRYMSDLHLEGGSYLPNKLENDKESLLILAGDIHVGCQAIPFLDLMCEQFKYVIYVFGNHEFYHHSLPEVRSNFDEFKKWNKLPSNLFILDNDKVTLEGITFIGATLWTDLRKSDPLVMHIAKKHMNDFHLISKGENKISNFSPADSVREHDTSVRFIKHALADQAHDSENTVVITHHLPTYSSVAPKWRKEITNNCFYTDLDYLMEKYSPAYWVHGHTHDSVCEPVGDTLVLCNPKGYGRENHQNFNQEAMFEI